MARAWIASSERAAAWAVLVAAALLAAPIVIVRYPPMGDLAMHEGLVAVMRHLHDPSWVPEGLYSVAAPQANQLFALAALLLSFGLPTDVACKVLVAAIVLATPLLAARLLARLGLSRWLALLAGPVACGWMFRWGLVANLAGFALLVFSLPELERLARRVSARAVVRSTACAGAVFFAHESSAIVFGAVAGLFAVMRSSGEGPPGDRWKRLVGRLAPALFVAGLCLAQWRASERLVGANMRAIGTDFGADAMGRLAILPGAVFGGGISQARLGIVGGLWIAALASSACAGRRRVRRSPWRVRAWRHRYAALAAAFVALYFAFPMAVGGTTLLAHRFLPPACLCLIVACSNRPTDPGRDAHRATALLRSLLPLLACGSTLAMLAVEMPSFVAADARYRALDRIIARVPRNVAVAQLDLTPRGGGHVGPIPAAAGRVLAERGGRMLFAMTDMPPNPVYVRADLRWDEPLLRMAHAPYAFMPAYDLTRFSYLLERNESDSQRALVASALAPEAEIVAEEGEWTLFRSRLAVVGLDTPGRALPSPAPETLGARVARRRPMPGR
jgi:hypothetical protein